MNAQEQALYDDIQQDLAWFSHNVIDRDMRKESKMLVKLLKTNPNNYHITVEDVETGAKYDLTCPLTIFMRVQAWGIGTIMEVDTFDKDIVKSVVRRDPLDKRGAYA